jgi:hypothetical protein
VTVTLVRPVVYTPIWQALLDERRPALAAAHLAVLEAEVAVLSALGGLS